MAGCSGTGWGRGAPGRAGAHEVVDTEHLDAAAVRVVGGSATGLHLLIAHDEDEVTYINGIEAALVTVYGVV